MYANKLGLRDLSHGDRPRLAWGHQQALGRAEAHPEQGGMALEQLLAITVRRDIENLPLHELDRILGSDAHHRRTPSRNYGDRDPLSTEGLQAFRCSAECAPSMGTVAEDLSVRAPQGDVAAKVLHVVRCEACGKAGGPAGREWRALVNWNYERAAEGVGQLDGVKFFNLVGLDAAEALCRVRAIRLDLWLRIAQGRCAIQAGKKVGGKYIAKLEAYLGWVNVAIMVLTANARGTPSRTAAVEAQS